jgi:hypothetical protein
VLFDVLDIASRRRIPNDLCPPHHKHHFRL